MKPVVLLAAACAFALAATTVPAAADECSGHDHETGTVVGGVGGAAIGGLASHSVVGAVAGGVVGALAGNAIARSEDCDHQARAEMREDRHDAYVAGRDDQARADADADRVAEENSHQAYEAGRDDQAARDADRQAREDADRRAADEYPQ